VNVISALLVCVQLRRCNVTLWSYALHLKLMRTPTNKRYLVPRYMKEQVVCCKVM